MRLRAPLGPRGRATGFTPLAPLDQAVETLEDGQVWQSVAALPVFLLSRALVAVHENRTMNTASQPSTQRHYLPLSVITPRALRENEAAQYLGFSASYVRNTRTADMRAIRQGMPIKGPRWVVVETAIRYLREDLDDWLNQHRIDPGQYDPQVPSGCDA